MSSELEGIELSLILPELVMLIGLVALIIVPNLGDARFRIPLTSFRVPVLIGGTRFEVSRDPRLPNWISIATILVALAIAQQGLLNPDEWKGGIGNVLVADEFSILLSNIFLSVLFLSVIATSQRLPANPNASAPTDGDSDEVTNLRIDALYENRRQVDFHILLLTTGIGMSLMAKSTHLFMLFVCMELASLSSYVLVGFHKESEEGGEAGTKYFIVGSVASAIGIYGMSLLYLWNGDLSISGLSESWQAMEGSNPLAAS